MTTLLEMAKSMDFGKLEEMMLVKDDLSKSVVNQKDGLTLNRVLEYLRADREAAYRHVCAHCRAKVPYDEAARRHIRAGVKITCHAQRLRERPSPEQFISSLHTTDLWHKKWPGPVGDLLRGVSRYSLPQHTHMLAHPDLSKGLSNSAKESFLRAAYGGLEKLDPMACDACQGKTTINGETCWHCEGEGIDPTK
jgi:hypothetical protein